MKVVGSLQPYESDSGLIRLTQDIMLAVAVEPGTQLYCLGLYSRTTEDPAALSPSPDLTVLAAPFPTESWRDLIRVSISLPPVPGSVNTLHRAFDQLGLRCRYIEITDGVDIGEVVISRQKESYAQSRRKLVLSTTFAVLEIEAGRDNELKSALRNLQGIEPQPRDRRRHDETTPRAHAEEILRKALVRIFKRESPHLHPPRLEWVSPMLTLNSLSDGWYNVKGKTRQPLPREGQQIIIRRIRKKTYARSVVDSRDTLLDVSVWVEQLRAQKTRPSPQYVVTTFSDSDDRYIGCQFHRLKSRFIVEFKVRYKRGLPDHDLRQLVFSAISLARGNISVGHASSRLESGDEFLVVVAHFSYLRDSQRKNVSDFLACVRKLVPKRVHWAAKPEPGEEKHVPGLVDAVAYGPSLVGEDYIRQDWFIDNPYNYTLPMTRTRYEAIFTSSKEAFRRNVTVAAQGMRMSLARTISKLLTAERSNNVALVGAHRLGKTSVLRLVHDYVHEYGLEELQRSLKSDPLDESTRQVLSRANSEHETDPDGARRGTGETLRDARSYHIPIYLNASVTPPHMIAHHVAVELESLRTRYESEDWLEKYIGPTLDEEAIRLIAYTLGELKKLFGRKFSQWRDRIGGEIGVSSEIMSAALSLSEMRPEVRLRQETEDGLARLQKAVGATVQRFPNIKLIILVDEVAEGLSWGGKSALGAWRHMLESDRFAALRWLVATTRPMSSDLPYSPVSNVFREYNLAALVEEEAEELLDKMEEASESKLAPVVTPEARRLTLRATGRLPYLMQVACVHIFEEATSGRVPLVSRELVMRVLRGKVLVELSEYFEKEWSRLPRHAQEEIEGYLVGVLRGGMPLDVCGDARFNNRVMAVPLFSPGTRRALDRSGLNGAFPEDVVVLLFSEWLYSRSAGDT